METAYRAAFHVCLHAFLNSRRALRSPGCCALAASLQVMPAISPAWAGATILLCSVAVLIASLVFLVKTLRKLIVQKAEVFINRYLFRNDLTAVAPS